MTTELAHAEMNRMRSFVHRIGKGITARVEIPKSLLETLYCNAKLSTLEIGALLGVSKKTVRLRLLEYGIDRRNLKQAFAVSQTHAIDIRTGGSAHPSWKGGRKNHLGYVMIHMPNHPESVKYQGYVLEHRLVMEQMIGRQLAEGEEVHHLNGIKNDNRPENLELLTKSEHMAFHANQRHQQGDPTFGFKKGGRL